MSRDFLKIKVYSHQHLDKKDVSGNTSSEAEMFWIEFFRYLRARGLGGVNGRSAAIGHVVRGPKRPSTRDAGFRIAARRKRHSLRLQDYGFEQLS